jgi:hypothetical protein
MAGQLFTFPLRLGLRVARGAVRSGMQVPRRAVGVATFVVRAATSGGSPAPAESPRRDSSETPPHRRQPDADGPRPGSEPSGPNGGAPDEHAAGDEERQSASDTGTATLEPERDPAEHAAEAVEHTPETPAAASAPDVEATPPHVTDEPTLVQSVAEPGAEDGAGAQVTIEEPWEGYAKLNARDVIGRLGQSSPEELAAVELYERVHKNRETVLAAVARQAKTQSGNRPAAD